MAKKSCKKKQSESLLEKTQELWKKLDDSIFEEVDDETCKKGQKFYFSVFEVVCFVLIGILFGVIIGYVITYTRNNSNDLHLREITSTYNNIVENYYDTVDEDKLMNAAIEGMVKSLDDPYTQYLDKNNTDSFNQTVDGSFIGIGVVVKYEDEYNHIIELTAGGPADKAGIQVDDIIYKIDDVDAKGLYGSNLTELIRGKVGTNVRLTIKRGEEELEYTVKREKIEITCVTSNIIEDDISKIGYIKIDNFSAVSYKQFDKELKGLEKKNIDSLIIDVRDNPGGHLDQVNKILSLFFDKKTVLYQIETNKKKTKVYSTNNTTRNYEVAVLVNGNSASASEVLASCFKERYKKGIVIGLRTYGKGTVQKSQNLSSGTSFKYTTEKWLTSKGKWLNREGLLPDVIVEPSSDYISSPSWENDNQLQVAVNKIKESK
jgi:carboxyl-terminal processing protease